MNETAVILRKQPHDSITEPLILDHNHWRFCSWSSGHADWSQTTAGWGQSHQCGDVPEDAGTHTHTHAASHIFI